MALRQITFSRKALIGLKKNEVAVSERRYYSWPDGSIFENFINGYIVGCQLANKDVMILNNDKRMVSIYEDEVNVYELIEADVVNN